MTSSNSWMNYQWGCHPRLHFFSEYSLESKELREQATYLIRVARKMYEEDRNIANRVLIDDETEIRGDIFFRTIEEQEKAIKEYEMGREEHIRMINSPAFRFNRGPSPDEEPNWEEYLCENRARKERINKSLSDLAEYYGYFGDEYSDFLDNM